MHVSAAGTDEEIIRELKPYVEGDCLVAIDAPLIVRNATGNRPAEAALNRDFARFDAGAHPANTSRPEFRVTPRGARLSAALGLDLNPCPGHGRRSIEVYPHPATVSLFRLGRTLKYKNKPGRQMATLRAELQTLMGLIEGLSRAEPALLLDRAGRDGRGSSRWSGPPRARATYAPWRIRSTPSSARMSPSSPPANPGGRRCTATSTVDSSSPRDFPTTTARVHGSTRLRADPSTPGRWLRTDLLRRRDARIQRVVRGWRVELPWLASAAPR